MAIGFKKLKVDKAFLEKVEKVRQHRRKRFRILICLDGTDEAYEGIQFASKFSGHEECDIILLYVRPIDQGLRSGGLQIRVARENMLDWGLELPGIKYLKRGLSMLVEEEELAAKWTIVTTHTDTWGDPLGDNKVEYHHESGKSIVLKLKTAPDPASGILDQYELGPYNLIILGSPSRWRGEIKSFFDAGVVQKVSMLAPCSVLVARDNNNSKGHLISTDGSKHSLESMRREAVLASHCGEPITLFTVARQTEDLAKAEKVLKIATDLLKTLKIDVADTKVGIGDPTEQIVNAGKNFSVIAVADSGKNWFKRFFVSSVAFNVMGASKTSVLNVR